MNKNMTYYGFDYPKVIEGIIDKLPALFDVIEDMTDNIMHSHGEKFIFAEDDSTIDTDQYQNLDRQCKAKMEVTRQIIGFLFSCQPPIYDSGTGEFFTLPHELNIDYAKDHFQEIADSGHDASERTFAMLIAGDLEKEIADMPDDDEMKASLKALLRRYQKEIEGFSNE